MATKKRTVPQGMRRVRLVLPAELIKHIDNLVVSLGGKENNMDRSRVVYAFIMDGIKMAAAKKQMADEENKPRILSPNGKIISSLTKH